MKGYTEIELKVEDVIVGDRMMNIRMDKPRPNSTAIIKIETTPLNIILKPYGEATAFGRWFGRGKLIKVLRKNQ